MPIFDFSNSKPIPAHKLDNIEEAMLNTFNNNIENDNESEYNGSGDENYQNMISSFRSEDEEDKNKNEIFSQNNIIEVSDRYNNPHNFIDKIVEYENQNTPEYNDMDYDNILIDLRGKYDNHIIDDNLIEKINDSYFIYNLDRKETGIKYLMYIFKDILDNNNINYDYLSLKSDNNIYKVFDRDIENEVDDVNILDNKLNNFPKLNKLDENKNNKYYIKKKYNIDIDDINVKFISFRTNLIKYKKKSINYKNKLKKEQTFCVEFKNNITNILKDIKELEKEYDEILEMEKMDQLKKLYIRLSQNIEKKQNLNDNNNIYNLFNKLDNQKVDKLYILADIGKELKDQDIEDENKFLDTFKNKELYYIYDLKNKNKISRFINMCNKLCLLKEKINLASIIKNNLLTSIRDLSQNNFTLLLNMF